MSLPPWPLTSTTVAVRTASAMENKCDETHKGRVRCSTGKIVCLFCPDQVDSAAMFSPKTINHRRQTSRVCWGLRQSKEYNDHPACFFAENSQPKNKNCTSEEQLFGEKYCE